VTVVYIATFTILSISGLLTLLRMIRGPRTLDRIMSLDVLSVLIVAGVAVGMAVTDSVLDIPLLVATAVLGFVGSLGVVRLLESREEHR
jgi:multicomponent Na+:H+ antiporter subunit F